jgi:hypothetical protein
MIEVAEKQAASASSFLLVGKNYESQAAGV